MKKHIHIFGASGSGTTTIAGEVCRRLGYAHFDSDNYYWLQTDEPFTVGREQGECLAMLGNDLTNAPQWILSGSLTGWGDVLIPRFDLVVFVYVPTEVRMERLRKRETERYGASREEASRAFLEWAAAYDQGTENGRSLPKHEEWLKKIECATLRIVNTTLEDSVRAVIGAIRQDLSPEG